MKKIALCLVRHPEHEDLYLHFERSDSNAMTIPGGHFDKDEAPIDAAIRELEEETGIDKSLIDSIELVKEDTVESKNLQLYLFLVKLNGEPELDVRVDPDKEAVRGTCVFLDPLKTDKELHVPKEDNIAIKYLEECKLDKSELEKADYEISHEMEDSPIHSGPRITAKKDGQEIGFARITQTPEGHISSFDTYVHEPHRRQGIANSMYSYAEKALGKKLVPHPMQTEGGKSLWQQKNKPFGKSELCKDEELNQEFFDDKHLDPRVREVLIDVYEDVIAGLKEKGYDLDVKFLILTGSLMGVNYDEQSDIDFHIGVDTSVLDKPVIDLLGYYAKEFNNKNYTLKGRDLEIYFQDANEPHEAPGIYDVLNDKWIKEPSMEHIEISDDAKALAQKYLNAISKFESAYAGLDKSRNSIAMFLSKLRMFFDTIKTNRKEGLQESGEKSVGNQAFKLSRRNGALEKLANLMNSVMNDYYDVHEKSEDLEKTRGLLDFKNLPKVNSRPDQQVQNVDTRRQIDLFSRKVSNEQLRNNYHDQSDRDRKIIRNSIAGDIRHIVRTPRDLSSATQSDFKRMGVNIPKEHLENYGMVVHTNDGKSHGFVLGEGKRPTGNRREHEGIHYQMEELGNKYGKDVQDHAQDSMNSLIHPDVLNHLSTYMQKVGYHPSSHRTEFIPHLYEMLHDPETRDIIRQTNPDFGPNEQGIMDNAKKSWTAIRDFASNLKELK